MLRILYSIIIYLLQNHVSRIKQLLNTNFKYICVVNSKYIAWLCIQIFYITNNICHQIDIQINFFKKKISQSIPF